MSTKLKPSANEILDLVRWWEKKRIVFNLCVGITGVVMLLICGLPVLFNRPFWTISEIFIYGIVVNWFYTLGWASGILRVIYFKKNVEIGKHKMSLFYLGTGLSVIITIFLSVATYAAVISELQLP